MRAWRLILVAIGLVVPSVRAESPARRIVLGTTVRQISGQHQGFETETWIPVWEVRTVEPITDQFDLYGKIQIGHGAVPADHQILAGEAKGDFFAGGIGLNYYPLSTRLVGLDAGMEVFQAKYRMRASYGPLAMDESDRFWGYGANLGLIGQFPLDRQGRWHLVWGVGYSFTDSFAHKASTNLDGWYGLIGISLTLGQ